MLLPRSINSVRIACLIATLLLLAACAAGPATTGDSAAAGTDPNGRPVTDRVVPETARTLYEQAVAAMAAGNSIDAELRFQEFLLQFPDFPGAHVNLAIIFAARGDDTAAEGSLTDALIIDPLYAPALNQLGMLLRRQGKFAEAESAYTKAVTASPEYALAHYNLGILNDLYFQRLDDALHHYQRYQELAGEDEEVSRWIADLTRRIGANQRSANVTE
jgi:tetratricopeptide (TPR) repeat protein